MKVLNPEFVYEILHQTFSDMDSEPTLPNLKVWEEAVSAGLVDYEDIIDEMSQEKQLALFLWADKFFGQPLFLTDSDTPRYIDLPDVVSETDKFRKHLASVQNSDIRQCLSMLWERSGKK